MGAPERFAIEQEHLEKRAEGKRAADARKLGKRSISVEIGGKEYRIRSDADEERLHRLAAAVDQAMQQIRKRTDTVDSHEIAVLTALNLARELVDLRDRVSEAESALEQSESEASVGEDRLRSLIEQVELELDGAPRKKRS